MARSHISLEASELNAAEDDWTEAELTIERHDEDDEELRYQALFMTPAEMENVCRRLRTYYEQGIWTMGTIER